METFHESLLGNIGTTDYPTSGKVSSQMGMVSGSKDHRPKDYKNPFSLWLKNGIGIELGFSHQMREDQKQVVRILEKGKNIYDIAKPGAGKTLPVITYWAQQMGLNVMLQLNPSIPISVDAIENIMLRPEKLKQILWLVPIRTLTNDIESDFINHFANIILQIINQIIEPDVSPSGQPAFPYISTKSSNPNLLKNYIINMQSFSPEANKLGRMIFDIWMELSNKKQECKTLDQQNASEGMIKHIANEITKMDQQFYEYLFDLIKEYIQNALVGKTYEGEDTTIAKNHGFLKPVIISIYESAPKLLNKLRTPLIVCDEAQRIQQVDTNQPQNQFQRARQISESLTNILNNPNTRNSQMILLSGSISAESAQNMIDYMRIAYGKEFADISGQSKPFKMSGKNPANIIVKEMNGLGNQDFHIRLIKSILANPNETGVILVIFGKNAIDNLTRAIVGKSTGSSQSNKSVYGYNPMGGSRSNLEKTDVRRIVKTFNENDITNPLLQSAVDKGFGFIYRPRDEGSTQEKEAYNRDNEIVQKLFQQGRIKVLISTDSIREGLNISARKMYLTTILLPPMMKPMDTKSLVQLVNRVGRVPGDAIIFTPGEFVEDVRKAVNMNPDDLPMEPVQVSTLSYLGHAIKQKFK